MLFATTADAEFATAVSHLAYRNPFIPHRIEHERVALGNDFVDSDLVWNVAQDWEGSRPNIAKLRERVEEMTSALRVRLIAGTKAGPNELLIYGDLASYLLYYRVQESFRKFVTKDVARPVDDLASVYGQFVADFEHFLKVPGLKLDTKYEPEHLFALFFQVRRAFLHIFTILSAALCPPLGCARRSGIPSLRMTCAAIAGSCTIEWAISRR